MTVDANQYKEAIAKYESGRGKLTHETEDGTWVTIAVRKISHLEYKD